MSKNAVEYSIDLQDRLSGKLRGVDRAVDKTERNLGGLGSSVNKISGMLGGVLAGAAIGAAVTGLSRFAGQAEQTRVAIGTFLGDMDKADVVIGKLNEFSNVTPFDNASVLRAGKGLLAFGETADNLIPTLKKIGDISAGTGKDFNELAVIYGKAKVAGTLYAEDINQLVEAGVPIMGEFAKALGTTESNVKKMASEGKLKFKDLETAFTNLTGEGGLFFNLMDAQSKTFLGRWSTLTGKLQGIGSKIGAGLNSILGPFIDKGIQATDWLLANLEKVGKVFEPISQALAPIKEAFAEIAVQLGITGDAGSMLQGIFEGIGRVITFIAPFVAGFARLLGTVFVKLAEVGKAIYQFASGNRYLLKSVAFVVKMVQSMFTSMAETLRNILGGIGDLLVGIFTLDADKILSGLKSVTVGIAEGAKAGFKGIGEGYKAFQKEYKGVDEVIGFKSPFASNEGKAASEVGSLLPGPPGSDPLGADAVGKEKGLKSGISEIKAAAPKTFNINIGSLIQESNINTTNIKEGADQLERKIKEILLRAINDSQVSAI